MSCNREHFLNLEALVRQELFGKDILDGLYPGIDIYFYAASRDEKYHFNRKTHRMEVPCGDDIYSTYEKTMLAFRMLDTLGIEYDYLVRTNTSTLINLNNLRLFIDGIPENDEHIYTGNIYSTDDGSGPEKFDMYALGKLVIFSREWIKRISSYDIENCVKHIKDESLLDRNLSLWNVDDNAIGMVVNCICMETGLDKHRVFRTIQTRLGYSDAIYEDKYSLYSKCQLAVPFRTYMDDRSVEYDRGRKAWNFINREKLVVDNYFDMFMKNDTMLFIMIGGKIAPVDKEKFIELKETGKLFDYISELFKKPHV